ncbi:MAG: hypothetical protein U0R69_08045 [Gaiellales bacterium]
MTAREIDDAAERIRTLRRRTLEALALTAACLGLAGVALAFAPSLTLALAAGTAFELLVAATSFVSRRATLGRLALDPAAYEIEEVRCYGARLARPHEREILARGIQSMLKDALAPGSLYLGDRVVYYARELDALARDLLSPAVRIHPVSVARCRALLTEAAESPLYNPRLPAEDLAAVLRRIRAGMEPVGPPDPTAGRETTPPPPSR